jgi:hypothetical protein
MAKRRKEEGEGGQGPSEEEEEERAAVLQYVVHELKDEPYIELAEAFHK